MKRKFLLKSLYIFLKIFIIIIQYCKNRELESPETILKNLYKYLNSGYNPNETIIINEKYYFNISFIQPLLNYKNSFFNNNSIVIIEPKLILYFNSKLYMPFNSKVHYCDDKNELYNSLSVSILMDVNFSNIIFNKLEDNSYILDYHFNNNDLSENSKIIFNSLENFSFFKNEISFKKKFLDIYINNTNIYLEQYPECDGLFLFNKIQNYILRTTKFNPTFSYSFYYDNPEVITFSYERHTKIDNIKSKIINIKIKIYYELCESFFDICPSKIGSCIIKEIIIDKNNIIYGDFEKDSGTCKYEDETLIKILINDAKDAIIPFL